MDSPQTSARMQQCNEADSKVVSKKLHGMQRSIKGFFYQSRVLMMLLCKGLNAKCNFDINAEWEPAGCFDDIVFRFKNGSTVWYFVQAKQLQNEDEGGNITRDRLLKCDNKSFDIHKYFNSYREIVRDGAIAENDPKYYIIWTNRSIDEDVRSTWFDEVGEGNLKMLGSLGKLFRFSKHGRQEIIRHLEKKTDLFILAEALAQLVANNKKQINNQVVIFMSYDTFLLQSVINAETHKFKDAFFDLEENAVLRDEFLRSLRRCDAVEKLCGYLERKGSEFTSRYCRDHFKDISDVQVSKLIIRREFKGGESERGLSYLIATCNADELNGFLDRFVLAANQPSTDKLEDAIKDELVQYAPLSDVRSDQLFLELKTEIDEWLTTKDDDFLSDVQVEGKLMQLKLRELSVRNEARIREYGVKFHEGALKETDVISRPEKIFVISNPRGAILSLLKLLQMVERIEKCAAFILEANQFVELERHVTASVLSGKLDLLVIEITAGNQFGFVTKWLEEVSVADFNTKIAVVVAQTGAVLSDCCTHINDSKNSFEDLMLETQRQVLQSVQVEFNGVGYTLDKILAGEPFDKIDCDVFLNHRKSTKIMIGREVRLPGTSYIPQQCTRYTGIDNSIRMSEDFIVVNKLTDKGEEAGKDVIVISDDETRFQAVCLMYKLNVHWLKDKVASLEWQQTRGSVAKLRKYTNNNYSKTVRVDAVQDINESIVIIAGKAGMGKSTLLSHVYEKCVRPINGAFVWYGKISLLDHATLFKSWEHKELTHEDVTNFVSSNLLGPNACTLSKELLNYFYHRGRVTLFLDGYDEITPDYNVQVLQLLQRLKLRSLWVSTRPYEVCMDLEEKLNATCFRLQPFSVGDVRTYLQGHWSPCVSGYDGEKFETFVGGILTQFSRSTHDYGGMFLKIPLQTSMIAQVYTKAFQEYCQSGRLDEAKLLPNLAALYGYFIRVKFENVLGDMAQTPVNNRYRRMIEDHFNETYQMLALSELFSPETVHKLFASRDAYDNVLAKMAKFNEEEDKAGLMDKTVNGSRRFIHRTFGEYFAAQWFYKHIKQENVVAFLKADGFRAQFKIIWNFLNCRLVIGNEDTATNYGIFGNYTHTLGLHNLVLSNDIGGVAPLISSNNVSKLLGQNDAGGRNVIHLAASLGNNGILTKILHGFNCAEVIDVKDELIEITAFSYALRWNYWDVCETLLEHGSSDGDAINSVKNFGQDYLAHKFARKGYIHLLRSLKLPRLSPDSLIIHSAVRERNKNTLQVVEYLEESGANIYATESSKTNALHIAAQNGNIEIAGFLIDRGIGINATDKCGMNALHLAVIKGGTDLGKMLVDRGVDINARTNRGDNALHFAAQLGNVDLGRLLIARGISVQAAKGNGMNALHFAAKNGNIEFVKLLVDEGVGVNSGDKYGLTAIHLAGKSGNVQLGNYLIAQGVTVDAAKTNGMNPLHFAAKNGNAEFGKMLIDNGVDTEAATMHGINALHCAASSGNTEFGRLLISSGVDVNSLNTLKLNALHLVAHTGNITFGKMLIDEGMDVSATGSGEMNALHFVAKNGNAEFGKLLIDEGVSIGAKNKDGSTAIHLAAINGNEAFVRMLIDEGADVSETDEEGRNTLHLAAIKGDAELGRLLIRQGVNTDALTLNGKDALHFAAQQGNAEFGMMLIGRGLNARTVTKNGRSALHFAAQQGNVDFGRLLIESGADVHAKTKNGRNALHFAAQRGNIRFGQMLIDNGVDVQAAKSNGRNALHYAAQQGNKEFGMLLVERGIDVHASTNNGRNALHFAAQQGNVGFGKLLIGEGIDIHAQTKCGNTALHFAAQRGNTKFGILLIGSGARVNPEEPQITNADELPFFSVSNKNKGRTPLHYAAQQGNTEFGKALIDNGANVHAKDKDGWTPLHSAVWKEQAAFVKLLIENGVNTNATANDGRSALHFAASKCNVKLAKTLIAEHADANALATDGRNALHYAARIGDTEFGQLLLDNEIAVNTTDTDGWNPLHSAVWRDKIDFGRLLIGSGVDVRACVTDGRNALHIAVCKNHAEYAKLIIDAQIDVNATTNDKMNALHYAARNGNTEIGMLLLRKTIATDACNSEGNTALHLAVKNNKIEFVTLLLRNNVDTNIKNEYGDTALDIAIAYREQQIVECLQAASNNSESDLSTLSSVL